MPYEFFRSQFWNDINGPNMLNACSLNFSSSQLQKAEVFSLFTSTYLANVMFLNLSSCELSQLNMKRLINCKYLPKLSKLTFNTITDEITDFLNHLIHTQFLDKLFEINIGSIPLDKLLYHLLTNNDEIVCSISKQIQKIK